MRNFAISFLIVVTQISCFSVQNATTTPIPEVVDAKKAITFSNVHYGDDAKQVIDIYLPANRSTSFTKTMILIHGGGYMYGDKSEFSSGIAGIMSANPDYAIINVNYRLYGNGKNAYPAQENDIKAMYNYVVTNLTKFSLSNKIVIVGQSAGAHFALLQAYKNSSQLMPKAVIDYYGPTDLAKLFYENRSVANNFVPIIGGTPDTHPELYSQVSPVNFIDTNTPPTLILQGAKDNLVLPSQSQWLKKKLDEKSIPNELYIYPNSGHGFVGADFNDSYAKISAFIKKWVN